MTWIRTIPPPEAEPRIEEAFTRPSTAMYPPEYHTDERSAPRPDGSSDSIVAAHSLLPEAMLHAMSTHAALIQPDMPLTRRQQEMISTVVSALNRCFY